MNFSQSSGYLLSDRDPCSYYFYLYMANPQANIVQHLIERGLITYESAVDGDLALLSGSSNHKHSRVMRNHSPGFFIKQIQRWEEAPIMTLQREAACYRLGHYNEDFASLTPLLPKYYDFDPVRHTLVIELLSGGESVSEFCLREGANPPGLGSKLGTVLADYHKNAGADMKKAGGAAALDKMMPWTLMIHRQPGQTTNFNDHSKNVLAFIQGNPQLCAALDALQAGWRTDSFIHGDLKWDNFIIIPQQESSEYDLKIVDWELAGFGDACWDVGSVFHSCIIYPIIAMQAVTEQLPANLPGLMRYCSADGRDALRDFWVAYVVGAQLDQSGAGDCVIRSMQHCAARMLQTSFELTEVLKGPVDKYFQDIIVAKSFCLAQVAGDILQNPMAALGHIFGAQQ